VEMSAIGLGCVKTPKSDLRVELSSRFRQFKSQQRCRLLLAEDNRENNSAPPSRAHVFTQPRPFATFSAVQRYVSLETWRLTQTDRLLRDFAATRHLNVHCWRAKRATGPFH